MRYGTLTVLDYFKGSHTTPPKVSARCDCGSVKVYFLGNLRRGNTKSCGCKIPIVCGNNFRKHGKTRTVEYKTWLNIRRRCTNPSVQSFQYYGAMGVKVCKRWESFENFLADMGKRPEGMSIDRINPWGDYEPSNCRWATPKEQSANRRNCAVNRQLQP